MADAETIRAWAKDNGHDINERGKIPAALQRAYDDAHPDPSAGVTDADFYVTADLPPDEREPDVPADAPVPAERKPRIVKPRATPQRAKGRRGLRSWLPATPKAKGPRTSLSEFASDTWRDLSMVTAGIAPPVSRVLGIQAPYVGVVFDEAVKGTPADAILQPIAKYSTSLRALNGIIGPPVFTLGITVNGQFNEVEIEMPDGTKGKTLMPDGRTAVMLAGLKYSLIQMQRISGLHMEEIRQRAEDDAKIEREVDLLIATILGFSGPPAPPSPPTPPHGTAAGGEVIQPTQVYRYPQRPVDEHGQPVDVMDQVGADPARL